LHREWKSFAADRVSYTLPRAHDDMLGGARKTLVG